MDLNFSEEQRSLRDEVRRFLTDRANSAAMREAAENRHGFDEAMWETAASELGFCAANVPEEYDGMGLGATELALIMEECGRRLACIPAWSTIAMATPLIAALASDGQKARLLPEIALGTHRVAVALPSIHFLNSLDQLSVFARKTGDGYVLDGTVPQVADLPSATLVLVPARLEDGSIGLFALPRENGITIEPVQNIDLTRPFGSLGLSRVEVDANTRLDASGFSEDAFAEALLPARLGLAAEQIGAAQGCLDLTLDYISGRVQFGRTIASFQAIKHRCAGLVVDLTEARSLLYGAAASLNAGSPDAAMEIDALGVLSTDVLWRTAEEAIQMHGGVGNTWEYDPHFYFRRAQASAFMMGSTEEKLGRIADRLIDGAAA